MSRTSITLKFQDALVSKRSTLLSCKTLDRYKYRYKYTASYAWRGQKLWFFLAVVIVWWPRLSSVWDFVKDFFRSSYLCAFTVSSTKNEPPTTLIINSKICLKSCIWANRRYETTLKMLPFQLQLSQRFLSGRHRKLRKKTLWHPGYSTNCYTLKYDKTRKTPYADSYQASFYGYQGEHWTSSIELSIYINIKYLIRIIRVYIS